MILCDFGFTCRFLFLLLIENINWKQQKSVEETFRPSTVFWKTTSSVLKDHEQCFERPPAVFWRPPAVFWKTTSSVLKYHQQYFDRPPAVFWKTISSVLKDHLLWTALVTCEKPFKDVLKFRRRFKKEREKEGGFWRCVKCICSVDGENHKRVLLPLRDCSERG